MGKVTVLVLFLNLVDAFDLHRQFQGRFVFEGFDSRLHQLEKQVR